MNRIKELRLAKQINQKDLAEIIGIAQPTLSGWETGRTQIDYANLIKIADYFNVSTDYLLGREEKLPENLSEIDKKIIETFDQLDDQQKQQAIEFAKFLLSRDGNATDKK